MGNPSQEEQPPSAADRAKVAKDEPLTREPFAFRSLPGARNTSALKGGHTVTKQ
jgi:hypothetical protein